MSKKSSMDKLKLFNDLIESYQNANLEKSKQIVQQEVSKIWSEIKKQVNFIQLANENLQEWTRIGVQNKAKHNLFWSEVSICMIINIIY